MQPVTSYEFDADSIKLDAYRLLALFYANKEIARLSDPEQRTDAASQLEHAFFSREMTRLLLSIAVGLRVLDDQVKALPTAHPARVAYLQTREQVNRRHNCMMFDDMPLREVCNKIVHATTVEPHINKGSESHEIDEYNWLGWSAANDEAPGEAGPQPEPVDWEHLSGNIRLGGRLGNAEWWQLLQVRIFVQALVELLDSPSLFSLRADGSRGFGVKA